MHTNIKQEAGQKLDTAVFMFLSRKVYMGSTSRRHCGLWLLSKRE